MTRIARNKARRVKLDAAAATLEEALDAVETRIRWYKARRIEVPAITVIAANVLREALKQ